MFIQLLTSPASLTPPIVDLEADALIAESPAVGSPSLGQVHHLVTSGVIAGQPSAVAPGFSQLLVLESLGCSLGVLFCGSPILATSDDAYVPVANRTTVVASYPSRTARVIRYSE